MSLDSRGHKSLSEFSSSKKRERSEGSDAPRCDVCGSEMKYSENAGAWLCWNSGCEGTKPADGKPDKGSGPVIVEEDSSETESDLFL